MFIDQVDVLIVLVGGRVHDPLGADVTKLFYLRRWNELVFVRNKFLMLRGLIFVS